MSGPGTFGVVCVTLALGRFLTAASAQSPALAVEAIPAGQRITIDGELFAEYLTKSGTKPAVWPIIGPTGATMTRSYSAGPAEPGEETDHPHHRSLWFGYEGLCGVNFWLDSAGGEHHLPVGTTVHREFTQVESTGSEVLVGTANDYLDATGRRVAYDERQLRFGTDSTLGHARTIEVTITLHADHGPLTLIDTKEGAFAMRVAETMRGDRGGQIENSRGERGEAAWGRRAEWVDYRGPVGGQTVGITMLAHPSSHSAEPRWHVRTYGLFAVNPFSSAAFTGGAEPGGFTGKPGQAVVLRHLVVLHDGSPSMADLAAAYKRYAEQE